MMNIKYGDSNLSVRYLEAFLQDEYNNTLRVSGIYDTYTHNNLIDYINLPRVVTSEKMYKALLEQYNNIPIVIDGQTEYKTISYCFSIVRSIDTITCSSKSVNKPDDVVVQAMKYLMDKNTKPTLLDFAKEYGWNLTTFISYVDTNSSDEYKIVLTQEKRKNLIPLDANSMVNLASENYMFDTIIENNTISKLRQSCTMIVPCLPDTEYMICHRFDNPDEEGEQQPVAFFVGNSSNTYPNSNTNTAVSNIESYSEVRGVCVVYKTDSNARNILISYPYDDSSYNTAFLILKKNNLNVEDVNTAEFVNEFWLIHSKFLDYLFGSSITELSDEDDIFYIQNLLSKIIPKKGIVASGVYTEEFRQIVKAYQDLNSLPSYKDRRPKIYYSLGYIDVQTEGQILKDIDNGVELNY